MKVAIIGSGISGSTAAWLLSQPLKNEPTTSLRQPKHPTDGPELGALRSEHQITVYEKNTRAGGRINTVTLKRSASQSDFSLLGGSSVDNLASIASASVTSNNDGGLAETLQLESLISRLGKQGTASATGTVTARSLHAFPDIELNSSVNVDLGFQVFNEGSSPTLLRLLRYLGIDFEPSNNSQSLTVFNDDGYLNIWESKSFLGMLASRSLGELIRKLIVRPLRIRLVFDVLRFNCTAADILSLPPLHAERIQTIGQYSASYMYSKRFIDEYLAPLATIVPGFRQDIPFVDNLIEPIVRHLFNNGLLCFDSLKQGKHDKRWLIISNGASTLIDKLLAPIDDLRLGTGVIEIKQTDSGIKVYDTNGDVDTYDLVICATHADETLEMLGNNGASLDERRMLRSIKYQPVKSVLHADSSFIPQDVTKWSSWNIIKSRKGTSAQATINLNKLANVPAGLHGNIFLTLDPSRPPKYKFADVIYNHVLNTPELRTLQRHIEQLNSAAIRSRNAGDLSGKVLYLGSWMSNGCVEDGLVNAINLGQELGGSCPFTAELNRQAVNKVGFDLRNVWISIVILMMKMFDALLLMLIFSFKPERPKPKDQ